MNQQSDCFEYFLVGYAAYSGACVELSRS